MGEMWDNDGTGPFYPTELKEAIVGYVEHFSFDRPLILLDRQKCMNIYWSQGMDEEEALECFEFNVMGTGGKGIPAFVTFINECV